MGTRVVVTIALVAASLSGCAAQAEPTDTASVPATVQVTCTPGTGVEVSSNTVTTSTDGVHLTVVNRSGHDDADVAYAFGEQLVGGERATDHQPWVLPAPPGELRLSCSPSPFDTGDRPATVKVVDPDNNWTQLETSAGAGCTQDGAYYPLPPSVGDSEHAALDAMVVESFPAGTRTYEVHRLVGGYERAGSGYGFVLFREGRASATGSVGKPDGRWSAQIDGSCAERNEPVIEPVLPTPAADGPPATLRIICMPDGVDVVTPRVRTSPHGVQIEVTDQSGVADPFLVFGKAGRHHGGDRLSNSYLSPLDLEPGTWQIGCSDHDVTDAGLRGQVTIVDPDRNWRAPALIDECIPDGALYAVGGQGPTEQAALADVLRSTRSTARVRLYPDGYWQRPGHAYVIRRTTGDFYYGSTYAHEDGSGWHAGLDGTCRPV
jgi:hypothetical protein